MCREDILGTKGDGGHLASPTELTPTGPVALLSRHASVNRYHRPEHFAET